jgi:phosphatidate cytidylyltransferase
MKSSSVIETLKRVGSAAVGLPIYAWCIITDQFTGLPIYGVTLFITLVTLYEFYTISNNKPYGKSFVKTGLFFGFIVTTVVYLIAFRQEMDLGIWTQWIISDPLRFFMGTISVMAVFSMALQLILRPIEGATYSLSITLAGIMVIVIPFSHIILMKKLTHGEFYIFLLNFVVMFNDSSAYFGGLLFGKHKTNYPVSPNKSYEGYLSGLLGSVGGVFFIDWIFTHFFQVNLFNTWESVLVGLMLSILATFGDLTESLIKRDTGVKDSGTIVPGHGGMWDTFDALIYAFPVFYYYLLITGVS